MKEEKLTPLQKLIEYREEVERKCLIQEQKLNEDFIYIQENSLKVLSSGFISLLFPKKRKSTSCATEDQEEQTTKSSHFELGDILSFFDKYYPIIWQICRPILTAWSIQKIQKWLTHSILKPTDEPKK